MYRVTQKMHLVKIICCFLIIEYCLPLQIACHLEINTKYKYKILLQSTFYLKIIKDWDITIYISTQQCFLLQLFLAILGKFLIIVIITWIYQNRPLTALVRTTVGEQPRGESFLGRLCSLPGSRPMTIALQKINFSVSGSKHGNGFVVDSYMELFQSRNCRTVQIVSDH